MFVEVDLGGRPRTLVQYVEYVAMLSMYLVRPMFRHIRINVPVHIQGFHFLEVMSDVSHVTTSMTCSQL